MIRKAFLAAISGLMLLSMGGSNSAEALRVNQAGVPAHSIASETGPPPSQEGEKEVQKLEDELKKLLDELKRLGNDMQDKVQNEIIPFLKKEIEKIRERIRRFRMDEEKHEKEGSTWT